jgi:hypothetical protein
MHLLGSNLSYQPRSGSFPGIWDPVRCELNSRHTYERGHRPLEASLESVSTSVLLLISCSIYIEHINEPTQAVLVIPELPLRAYCGHSLPC